MNKPKGAAQTLALSRQQLAQAKASAMPEECIRILESKVQKEEGTKRGTDFVVLSNLERRRWKRCTQPRIISSKRSRR